MKLSIRTKLLGAVGANILLLIMLGGLMVFAMSSINDQTEQIGTYDDRQPTPQPRQRA